MAKNEEVIEEDVGRDHREGVPREGSGVGGGYEETAEQGVEKGEEEAEKARAAAKALFVGGGDDANMPTTEISADKLVDGKIGILNLMVACGLAPSNKQARQLVEQGGVLVNDEKVPNAQFAVTEEMLKAGVKIRKGKKVFHKAVLA